MSVKSSISLSDQQDAFARALVAEGRFSSVSAVIQHGLDMLQQQDAARAAETDALRAVLVSRAAGPFVSADELQDGVAAMIAEKRAARVGG